jgi:hypothetical protein
MSNTDSPKPGRPPLRPTPTNVEDPRERAAKRAAEIRGHLGGDMDEGVDDFAAPPAPPGWSYEWKRKLLLNKEDPAYSTQLARKGWEPVPADRLPDMMPAGSSGATIERNGMVLMERPLELVEEAKAIERRRARQQVDIKAGQLKEGKSTDLMNQQTQKSDVRRSYSGMPIAE